MSTPCPHCDSGQHIGGRWLPAWGVFVAPDRDADGQPTHLVVQPTAGAHVAQEDADWLRDLIRNEALVREQRDRAIADWASCREALDDALHSLLSRPRIWFRRRREDPADV